jgi:glutathione S-transferase
MKMETAGHLRARPSIERAVAEEFKLYRAELARHKAAA